MELKHHMKKTPVICGLILGTIFITAIILVWDFPFNSADATTPVQEVTRPAKVICISEALTFETRSFPGIAKAARDTKLAFRVGGPLIEFDVRIGRKIGQGEMIAKIDPRDFEIRVMRLTAAVSEAEASLKAMRQGARPEDIRTLKANLNAARAQLTEAELNFNRHKILYEKNVVPKAKYDSAKAAYDMTKAGLEAASQSLKKGQRGARAEDIEAMDARIKGLKTDLKAAKNALEDTVLQAPFTGIINEKQVENYETVAPGQPVVSMLDISNTEISAAIPENLMVRKSDFLDFSCEFDAYPGKQFDAALKEIGRKTRSANQSYPLTVIPNLPDGFKIHPGMAATVNIRLKHPGSKEPGFSIPIGAVFADENGESHVWITDPKTMRVHRTRVRTGNMVGENIQVLSGLKPGNQIVTAGAHFLKENQKIRILETMKES